MQTWLAAEIDRGASAATSWLGRVELMRVVARFDDPSQTERARYLLEGLDMIPLTEPIIAAAERIGPAALGSLDAIHLAAAAAVEDGFTAFVTYDRRLLDVCRAVGLPAVSPGATA